jgi:hypothetical protein
MNGWRASIRRHKTHCIAAEGGGAARSMEYGGLDMEQQSRLTLRSSPGALPSQQNRGITLVWVMHPGGGEEAFSSLLLAAEGARYSICSSLFVCQSPTPSSFQIQRQRTIRCRIYDAVLVSLSRPVTSDDALVAGTAADIVTNLATFSMASTTAGFDGLVSVEPEPYLPLSRHSHKTHVANTYIRSTLARKTDCQFMPTESGQLRES